MPGYTDVSINDPSALDLLYLSCKNTCVGKADFGFMFGYIHGGPKRFYFRCMCFKTGCVTST